MLTSGRHRTPDPGWHGPSLAASGTSPAASGTKRRSAIVALALALGVVIAGALTVVAVDLSAVSPAVTVAATGEGPSVAAAPDTAPADTAPPESGAPVPVRATAISIPALDVRSELNDLDVDGAGVLVPPDSPDVPGWFRRGTVPGEVGPAVIAGHVDSRAGPGVFFALKDLDPGAVIRVERSDGRAVEFRVTDVAVFPKDRFPTARVYGPTPGVELRLITCGGEFDRSARRYLRNVIVSAVLLGPA